MDEASLRLLIDGFGTTIWLSLLSMSLSMVLGTAVGVMRVSPIGAVAALASGYTEFFRNIPLLIVLFFTLNGLPYMGITLPFFWVGVAGLTVYTGAYVAEVVRAGLQAIGANLVEASRSLGLSWLQTMRYVLLPFTFRTVIPPMGTLFIALVKNTSLASAVAVPDLLYQSEVIEGRTFNPDIFIIAGMMYLLLTLPLAALVNVAEQRLALDRVVR